MTECVVSLISTDPYFCISYPVESPAWPQLRTSESGLFCKAGQQPELNRGDEKEAREPRAMNFEEETTHLMFLDLG